jgi:excisionase family DNA binding protein
MKKYRRLKLVENVATRDWLRVREVAELLGLTPARAYDLIAQGELPAVRIGERSIRINRRELERFLLEDRRVVVK